MTDKCAAGAKGAAGAVGMRASLITDEPVAQPSHPQPNQLSLPIAIIDRRDLPSDLNAANGKWSSGSPRSWSEELFLCVHT